MLEGTQGCFPLRQVLRSGCPPPRWRGVNPAASMAAFQEPKTWVTVMVVGHVLTGFAPNSQLARARFFQSRARGGFPSCSRAHFWIASMMRSRVQ